MTDLQSNTQVHIELEDPEDHHLYIAYSDNAKDKAVADTIMHDLNQKNLKCLDPDKVYPSTTLKVPAIEDGVDRCMAVLLLLSKSILENGWLRFLCTTIQKRARERNQSNSTIVVPLDDTGNLDDLVIQSIVNESQVLKVGDVDFVDKVCKLLSVVKNPPRAVLPVGDVAIGLAWTFYYGYLQKLLPGLRDRLTLYEKKWREKPDQRIMSWKAFLIIPTSCFCPTSLCKEDDMFVEPTENKIIVRAARAGSLDRTYDFPVYMIKSRAPGDQTYYVSAQFAGPVVTMYEIHKGQIGGLREQELKHQMHLFCHFLRSILRHSESKACHDRVVLICYEPKDKGNNPLSKIVLEKVKQEIKREIETEELENEQDDEIESDDIENPEDLKTASESAAAQKEVTFEVSTTAEEDHGRQLLPRYLMKPTRRGRALILSVREKRPGTEQDEAILRQLWTELEFELDVRINPTAQEMADALLPKQQLDHSQYNAFVCCILSHGRLGQVLGRDNNTAKITDLTYLLNDNLCPGLAGKPKMFFIQACQRGWQENVAQDKVESDEIVEEDDASIDRSRATLVPGDQDFLMSYATLPGYKAYRTGKSGTFYIKALSQNIREHRKKHDMDLESILKNVSAQVYKEITAMIEKKKVDQKQFPFHLTTMNKLIFL